MPTRAVDGRDSIARGRVSTRPARLRALVPVLLVPAVILWSTEAVSGARAGAAQPGAYCPLPKKGEKPVCLAPAQAKYEAFFAGLDGGKLSGAAAAAVESDLTGDSPLQDTYLALSSLTYGYWRLAEQVGAAPDADPALLARLQHWNDLLLDLYGESRSDPRFQAAVREAAVDLHRRTPALAKHCPHSYPGGCDHTEELVRALAAIDGTASVRSPLSQLLERLVGDGLEEDAITRPASDRR